MTQPTPTSDLITSDSSYLWMSGFAYRGAPGAPVPWDLLTADDAEAPTGFHEYGGVDVGFAINTEGGATPLSIFNGAPNQVMKVRRDNQADTVVFRGMTNSWALALTKAQGGRIIEHPNGAIEIEKGQGEEFSLALILHEGAERGFFYSDRVTQSTPGARGGLDGESLDGVDLSLLCLSPLREILPGTPVGAPADAIIKVDENGVVIP